MEEKLYKKAYFVTFDMCNRYNTEDYGTPRRVTHICETNIVESIDGVKVLLEEFFDLPKIKDNFNPYTCTYEEMLKQDPYFDMGIKKEAFAKWQETEGKRKQTFDDFVKSIDEYVTAPGHEHSVVLTKMFYDSGENRTEFLTKVTVYLTTLPVNTNETDVLDSAQEVVEAEVCNPF